MLSVMVVVRTEWFKGKSEAFQTLVLTKSLGTSFGQCSPGGLDSLALLGWAGQVLPEEEWSCKCSRGAWHASDSTGTQFAIPDWHHLDCTTRNGIMCVHAISLCQELWGLDEIMEQQTLPWKQADFVNSTWKPLWFWQLPQDCWAWRRKWHFHTQSTSSLLLLQCKVIFFRTEKYRVGNHKLKTNWFKE